MAHISIFNKEIEVTPGDIEEYPGNPGHALVVGEINKEAVKDFLKKKSGHWIFKIQWPDSVQERLSTAPFSESLRKNYLLRFAM